MNCAQPSSVFSCGRRHIVLTHVQAVTKETIALVRYCCWEICQHNKYKYNTKRIVGSWIAVYSLCPTQKLMLFQYKASIIDNGDSIGFSEGPKQRLTLKDTPSFIRRQAVEHLGELSRRDQALWLRSEWPAHRLQWPTHLLARAPTCLWVHFFLSRLCLLCSDHPLCNTALFGELHCAPKTSVAHVKLKQACCIA